MHPPSPRFLPRIFPSVFALESPTAMYEGIAKLPRHFLDFKHYCSGYLIQRSLACLHFPTLIHYTPWNGRLYDIWDWFSDLKWVYILLLFLRYSGLNFQSRQHFGQIWITSNFVWVEAKVDPPFVLPLTYDHHGGLNPSIESAGRRKGCDATSRN